MIYKRILGLLIIATCIGGCDHHSAPAPSLQMINAQKAKDAAARVQRTNFDLLAEKLPPNFVPSDPQEVLAELSKLNRTKDQYESTAQYDARLKAMQDTVLYDEVKLNGGFAFELVSGGFHYNADKQEITCIHSAESDYSDSSITAREFTIRHRQIAKNDSDRLEVFANVYREKYYKEITFEEDTYLSVKTKNDDIGSYLVKIKMAPETAKSLEGKLSMIIVGSILPPYLSERDVMPGTYHDDIFRIEKRIPFGLKGIWIINKETGEILSKDVVFKKWKGNSGA